MNKHENRIELMNYLNVTWKRKWFIIVGTFLFISAAAVIGFLVPSKWEVDAIILSSNFVYRSEDGILRTIMFMNPKSMASLINQATYNNLIVHELGFDTKDFPKLNADNLKDTNLVRISIKENDIEKAKLILHSLCNYLKRNLDSAANVEIKRFDSQIKSKETEKFILERKIKAYKNKINIIKQRKQEIEKEMSDIREKKEELEKERSLIQKKKKGGDPEGFAMLNYSNEIQQSSMNYSILNNSLSNKKIEEEIINLEIEDKERRINQIEDKIRDLNESKKRIYYTQIVKEPTSSVSPVSPKKLLNILIAVPLGFIIFTMFAFFFEYIEKQKAKSKG